MEKKELGKGVGNAQVRGHEGKMAREGLNEKVTPERRTEGGRQ